MALKNLIPMLNVSDIEASLEFYREALDFKLVSNSDALRVTSYGMREFSLVDPDGHMLSFGQDEVESQQ